MQETIEMKKYALVEAEFEISSDKTCMIRAMLSLERLWTPFLYATRERTDIQEKTRIYMDGVWESIFDDNVESFPKEYYEQILDEIDEEYCGDESNIVQECYYDQYLINALAAGFGWFFCENRPKRPDIVMSTTDLIHDKIVDDNNFVNEQEKITYFSKNKYMLDELRRIDEDYEIGVSWVQNKEKILQLKEKYQNMWIVPVGEKI